MKPNTYCQGEHICTLYDTEEEQLATAAEYLADGLRAGERVFYVGESVPALRRFRAALATCGVDAAAKVKRGALIESTHAEAHLAGGHFDVERMMRLLNQAVACALDDGFAGLRTCGDMSWLLQKPAGAESVVEYEALLNQFFEGIRGAGMCQYDRRRLPLHFVDHGLATHSSAVIDGVHKRNPFFCPASIAVTRVPQPADVEWKIRELRRTPA